jgi:hypothetical protein
MPATKPRSTEATRQSRQKILLLALAAVLMAAGLVVLLLLKRLPLPLRLTMGFVDFTAAAALLLLLRQKFPRR